MADVLIVDDDPDVRAVLAITLEDEGHKVREAGDGAEALEALATKAPDAVILDVMMPGIDGFGVLARRREQGLAPDTRILLLTCKSEEQDFVRGWELGADEYLTKPFDPDVLVRRISELLVASDDELTSRRDAEIQKAQLLDRLENAFANRRTRRVPVG